MTATTAAATATAATTSLSESLATAIMLTFPHMTADNNPASPALARENDLPVHPVGADEELASVGRAIGAYFAAARTAGLSAVEAAHKLNTVTAGIEAICAIAQPRVDELF